MPRISRAGTRAATKRVIASFKKHMGPNDIRVEHTLKGRRPTGLGFTEPGLNSLTRALNDEFRPYETSRTVTQVRAAGNVRTLYLDYWKQVPARRRA